MSSIPRDRPGRFYFERIKELLVGKTNPCADFTLFQVLHDAVGHKDMAVHNRAFKCLYDRYLTIASREATRFKLRDEAKAAEALDSVFVTMHQRIHAGKLHLADEQHMANYIRLGVRFRLLTDMARDMKMPLLHADDLQPILTAAGVRVESELEHMLINEAVEKALKAISDTCQQKLLLWQMGYSHEEIAVETGITPASAKTSVYRCRLELRAELLKLGVQIPIGPPPKGDVATENTEQADRQ